MSVMTSRGLPPIGSLDQHQQQHHQEEHDFDAYGYPGDDSIAAAQAAAANITESSFVRRAIAGNVVTLQQAQDLLSLMQSNAGDNDVPPGLVQEREQRYEQTVEKLAVAMSLEQAGFVGAVFFLDDGRSYGMLKTADRRLTLFVPPSSLYTTTVFDLDSASHLPFLPTEQCNYSIYVKAPFSLAEPALEGAPVSEAAAQNNGKGKEELVPFPVATAAAATAAATTAKTAAAPKLAPVAKPVAKKISSALVPSDDEEDEEEDEEKPTPTKKRQAPADEQLAAPEEKEKRAKPEPKKKVTAVAAKKSAPAAATTVATTTAAAAAVATEHKK